MLFFPPAFLNVGEWVSFVNFPFALSSCCLSGFPSWLLFSDFVFFSSSLLLRGSWSYFWFPTITNLLCFPVSFYAFFQVALVSWSEKVGLTLVHRDLSTMTLRAPSGQLIRYTILQIFPFSSETKRMGIIVQVSEEHFWLCPGYTLC